MEKRDHRVFEDVFHAVVDKAQMTAGKTKKLFKNPLRIIDASVISLCMATYDWASYGKAKGAVKLHLNLDGDNLMPYDAYLSTGKVHDVHGMAELCDESGVIYVLDRGYVDSKVWFNTPRLAAVQTTYCFQKHGIKPKNPLTGSRGRV
jgi:hypothetical protein